MSSSHHSSTTTRLTTSDGRRLSRSEVDNLLCIDAPALQGRVHFRHPSLLCTFHETYSSDEYDRSPVRMTRDRSLAMPPRGDRVYYQDENAVGTASGRASDMGDLTARLRRLSVNHNQGTTAATRANAQVDEDFEDDFEDDAATRRAFLFAGMQRPGTPLPSVFVDDSDSEEEDASPRGQSNIASPGLADVSSSESDTSPNLSSNPNMGQQAESYFEIEPTRPVRTRARRPRTYQTRVPSLSRESCSSEDSEGPLSPLQDQSTAPVTSAKGSTVNRMPKSGVKDAYGCFDGF